MRSKSSAQKTDDSVEGRMTGSWTAEEKEKFVEGLEIYGKDYHQIADFIGTRDFSQVRSYYRAHMVRIYGPDWKSHELSSRKRKNVHNETSVLPKKTKSSTYESPSPLSQRLVARKPIASTTPNTRNMKPKLEKKVSPVISKVEAYQVHDILPPFRVPSNVASQIVSKPKKVENAVKVSSAPVVMEDHNHLSDEISKKERVLELLRKEEVQSVLSGLVGFLTVIAIKKLMG